MLSTGSWFSRLTRNRFLDVGAAIVAMFSVVRIVVLLPSRARTFDFNHYYASSQLLWEGKNPYLTPLAPKLAELGFVPVDFLSVAGYPPLFLRLFGPLAALPPRRAFALWVGVETVSLGAILALTALLLRGRQSARGWIFVCEAAVSSEAVLWSFCFSQVDLLLAAMVLAGYFWLRRGRFIAACLAVTAAGLVKFYPFALLPWFLWRSGSGAQERLKAGAFAAGLSAITLFLTGPGLWKDFFQRGLPIALNSELKRNFHYALPSFVTNLGLASSAFDPADPLTCVWGMTGTLAGLLIIGSGYWVCLCSRCDMEAQFCLLCAAMLAGFVTVQAYYFVWLIFPMAAAALRVAANPSVRRIVYVVLVGLMLNELTPPSTALFRAYPHLKVLASNIPLYGLIALGVYWCQELRRQLATAGREFSQ
jgi:hypothetical protein